MRALMLAWLVAAAAGCGTRAGAANRSPRDLVSAWQEAVRADDPRAAYALLSAGVRGEVGYDEWLTRWKASRVERAAQAAALERAMSLTDRGVERARLTLPDGKSVELARSDRGWRMEVPLVTGRQSASAREALRHLATAVEKRSYEAVVVVLARCTREAHEKMLERFHAGLIQHIGDEIEVSGNRAILTWKDETGRYRVKLVREEGEWRVEDVVAPPAELPPGCGE